MSITASDILFKYSTKIGSAGNSQTQTNPDASLGKYISTSVWSGGVLNDMFDNISGLDNLNNVINYRCFFIHNNHGTLTYSNVVVWLSAVSSITINQLGVDPTGITGISSGSAQAVQISTQTAVPVGVTFSTPTTEGAGISIGSLMPGQCCAIWIKRTATNSAAASNDGITISFGGDSL